MCFCLSAAHRSSTFSWSLYLSGESNSSVNPLQSHEGLIYETHKSVWVLHGKCKSVVSSRDMAKYLARHIDLLHSSQSLSCVTASVPCCRVQLSNLFNLVLLRKLGSPPSPCSDVAEIRPFLITRKSMGHPTSEDQGSDPAIKGLPKKSSPVVPASFESQVEVSFSQ